MSAESPEAPGSPPLTMRIRPAHWIALDYAIACLLALLIFATMFRGPGLYRFPLTPLLVLCLSLPVALRRRGPLRALAILLMASALTMAVGGEITRGAFLPVAFVLYLVAATGRRTVAVIALVVSLVVMTSQGLVLHLSGLGSGNAVAAGLVMIICWTAGYSVQQRRSYTAHLQDQVASTAVAEERLRIARELHDVVAHSMTVVAVQAGFGEYVFDSQPGEARAALGAIQTVSREALGDMQRMLGVLRQDGSGPDSSGQPAAEQAATARPDTGPDSRSRTDERTAPADRASPADSRRGLIRTPLVLTPAPSLADLDRLVARTAGAGVAVAVERTGRIRDVPAGVDLSAYRIVQEALTNVVKHSGAGSCQVVVRYGAGDLSVEITDPGSARPGAAQASCPGHGILGMRERVSLCGGEFSAVPLPGQGFRVRARLPLGSGAP